MPSKSKRYAVGKRRCHNKKRVTKKAYKRCRVGYNYNLRSMRGGGYIFVKNSQGISKQIQKTDTVVELMSEVADAFKVTNAYDINLSFAGKNLDDQILAQIPSGATIHFTISPPRVRFGDRC
jgi:hypothetical protein